MSTSTAFQSTWRGRELPDGWRSGQLGDIADIVMGNSPPGDSYNVDGVGAPLINGPVEFSEGPLGKTVRTKFTTAPNKFCAESDLLICVRGSTTGRTNVAAFDACIGRGVASIRARECQQYVNHFICAERSRIFSSGNGSTFPSVSQKQLAEIEIPLPPLSEQKRIADILDKADAIRRKRQEAAEVTQELGESSFLEMFGHPLGQHSWKSKAISDVGRVITGNTPSTKHPEYFDGEVPWIRPSELGDWHPVEETERTLTAKGLAVARSIRAGGTLVCCIGATLGKVGIAASESAFNQQINAVDFGEEIDDWYGMYCMRLMADRFIAEATHTTLPILNKGGFSKQRMPVPPIDDQARFGQFVMKLLRSRSQHERASASCDYLFNSLVQRAFKGEL